MKNYESAEQAKSDLFMSLASRGVATDAAMQDYIKKIVAAIPASSRETYDADETIAAAQYCETYFLAQDGNGNGNDNPPDEQNPDVPDKPKEKVVYVQPVLPPGVAEGLNKALTASRSDRVNTTRTVCISDLIVKTPMQSSFLTGKTVVPKISAESLAKYEKNLVDDVDNKKAFADIKAAMENGQALPVNVSETAHTLLGVKLKGVTTKDKGKAAAATDMIKSLAALTGFVVSDTIGQLATDISPINVGAKLRQLTPVTATGQRATTESKIGKPGITIVGRLTAIKAGNFEVAYEQAKEEPTVKKLVSVENSFKVRTNKKNQKGQVILKTVRPKGELADYPNFVPKDAYKNIFPLNDKNVVSSTLSDEQQAQNQKLIESYYAAASGSALGSKGAVFGDNFHALIEDVKRNAQASAGKDEEGME